MASETSVKQPTAQGSVPAGFKIRKEGKAIILQQEGKDAFFNPAQVVNRDLSIAVLRQFVKQRQSEIASGKLRVKGMKNGAPRCLDLKAAAEKQEQADGEVRILEGLAASGLRAIRYAMEIEGVARVDANDLDDSSVESIRRSVAYTGGAAAEKVSTSQSDARIVMLQRAGIYDAVDLDPYGTPAPLLDSAVQAVAEGGLLMVTATDMAVLCGNHGEACWAKYGSYPLHRAYCHEMALRILLAALQSHAARHKRIIVPVVSLSIDFYVRIFVRIYTSPKGTKDAASQLVYAYQSTGCDSFYLQPVGRKEARDKGMKYWPGKGPAVPQKCPETGSGFNVGGPFWAEPLHDTEFVGAMLEEIQANQHSYPSHQRLQSILTTVLEEIPDAPLYYSVHELTKLLHTTPPAQDKFRSALVNAGYRVSSTHANPLGVKTDAPPEIIWDVMRAWAKQHPGKKIADPGSAMHMILSKEPKIEVNFSRATSALSASRQSKVARFLPNPQPHWGPKRKHTRQTVAEEPWVKKAKQDPLVEAATNGNTENGVSHVAAAPSPTSDSPKAEENGDGSGPNVQQAQGETRTTS